MNNFKKIYNRWMTTFYVSRHTTLKVARCPLTESSSVRYGDLRVGEDEGWVEVDIFFFRRDEIFFFDHHGVLFSGTNMAKETHKTNITCHFFLVEIFFRPPWAVISWSEQCK